MVTKSQKEETISRLQKDSEGASIAFVADHSKLTVAEITELRRALKNSGKCIVIKNTLAERAFAGTGFEAIKNYLNGPSLLVLGNSPDVSLPIKDFLEYRNKTPNNPKLSFKGGVLAEDGSALDGPSIEAIGKLPPKEVLLAQIAGSLTSTPSQIVQTINQIINGIGELAVKVAEKNQ